eukprot:1161615-Pelagomonas_calceolata.AAC.11
MQDHIRTNELGCIEKDRRSIQNKEGPHFPAWPRASSHELARECAVRSDAHPQHTCTTQAYTHI